MKKQDKSRYFTLLLYKDSAPDNYLELLESLGVPMALSPWHDRDVKTDNLTAEEQARVARGETVYKKPHRHVVYIAHNPVTANAVRNKLQRLFAPHTDKTVVNMVQIIASTVANAYNYLTHDTDDCRKKNKAQYDKSKIIHLSNFDLSRYQVFDAEMRADALALTLELIRLGKMCNIIDLTDYIAVNGSECIGCASMQQFNTLCRDNAGLLRLYFDGNYQRYRRNREVKHEYRYD